MTPETARTTANVLVVAAGTLAFAVLRNPRWRRAAWQLLRSALTTTLPRMVADETREAWAASGHGA